MKVKFTKMHGAGNDFVVLDGVNTEIHLTTEQLRFLADRHFGVGADQILLIEKPSLPDCDFTYRIFNQDGGEVEMCGNGARCFAKYVFDHRLTDKRKIRVQTMKGIIVPELLENGLVKIDMGVPSFRPEDLPFVVDGLVHRKIGDVDQWKVDFQGKEYWFSICSMGNPHAVFIVPKIEEVPICELGSYVETLENFPNRVNVEFLQVNSPTEGVFRVWERGVGETLACGTGNCAAFAVARRSLLVDTQAKFENLGGSLELSWLGAGQPLYLIGPAVEVFESEIDIP